MRASTPLTALAGLVLASCTAATAKQQEQPQQAAAKPKSCIPIDQIVARRVAGPGAVEFDVVGKTYRNDLASSCPGLARLGTSAAIAVTTGAETGMLCAGDRVKIFDPVEIKSTGLRNYPFCQLGKFTEVAH
jgi:hypothetical protein